MSSVLDKFARMLPCSLRWLAGSLLFLAFLVIVRFLLEIGGTASAIARYFSSNAAICLAAIYLGAVAPLRGVTRFTQLILPSL